MNEYDYHHKLKKVIQLKLIKDENNENVNFTDFNSK